MENPALFKKLLVDFLRYAKKKLNINKPIKVILKNDIINAKDPIGKTALYDPKKNLIIVFITDRLETDVLRSLSHELVHLQQNESGQYSKTVDIAGDPKDNEELRKLEADAYEQGNLLYRDWEDLHREQRENNKGENKMSGVKDHFVKRNEKLEKMLMEKLVDKFDKEQLKKGVEVEREHTDDLAIARKIAEDHLKEDPDYYTKLLDCGL